MCRIRGSIPPSSSPVIGARRSRKLGIPDAPPVILWVGRMVPVKALGVLLQACAELRDTGQDFLLYLVGDGPLRKSLESEAASLGLGDRVNFAGPKPQGALPDWYRASDVVALPSYSEGIPNVLREARACGRPFVATRVGGVPEVADTSSVLVEPGSGSRLPARRACGPHCRGRLPRWWGWARSDGPSPRAGSPMCSRTLPVIMRRPAGRDRDCPSLSRTPRPPARGPPDRTR